MLPPPAGGPPARIRPRFRSCSVHRSRPSLLTRIPSPGLVVGAIASVQFGAGLAATLFAHVGPGGAVLLRLVSATIVLVAVSRPRVRGLTRRQLVLTLAFGFVLAAMNESLYHA